METGAAFWKENVPTMIMTITARIMVPIFSSFRMPLIRKREPDKTSASELIESQQGFSVAIPVLQVQCEIRLWELLPELEFIGIFALIPEYRRFYIQLVVP